METISIHGLGKLGCSMLACFAHKGWDVIGVDILESSVNFLNSGKSPICEPRVQEMIADSKSRIKATTDGRKATAESDVSFIIVPTPSKPDGSFSTEFVETAAAKIAMAIAKKKNYHLVVVTSTVLPGDMARIEGIINSISGKNCGSDYGLCYNPDFIAIGRIVHDFMNPDMILIGQSDPASGRRLQEIHEKLVDNEPEFHRMSYYNAELAKISLNSYCTMKITFANVIAEICEKLPDGDAWQVLDAVGADSRVGKRYFKPGLAYSGPCFPRDCKAFSHAANGVGVTSGLATTTDMINQSVKHYRMNKYVRDVLEKKGTSWLSVLGVTYKEDTILVEESASLALVENLSMQGITAKIYDPMGIPEAKRVLRGSNVVFTSSIGECLENTSVCFVGAPWKEFKELKKEDFIYYMDENPAVIDPWGLYEFDNGIDHWKIGRARRA